MASIFILKQQMLIYIRLKDIFEVRYSKKARKKEVKLKYDTTWPTPKCLNTYNMKPYWNSRWNYIVLLTVTATAWLKRYKEGIVNSYAEK